MAFEVERTRALFADGLPLADRVEGRDRLYLRLFTLGGLRVLDAIRGQRYDVLSRRPTVTRARKAWLLLKTYVSMRVSGELRRRPRDDSRTTGQ
jgi:phytoene/squalene synthetase